MLKTGENPSAMALSESNHAASIALERGAGIPFPGRWQVFGRAELEVAGDAVTIANGFAADLTPLADCELRFRARALPVEDRNVQIWGAIRVRDRESRYMFGLRGGLENQVYLARMAPDGGARFMGFAPLEFEPRADEWYELRVLAMGRRFMIFLGDEDLPRINIVDDAFLWDSGGVAIGGGWLPVEYAAVRFGSPGPEAQALARAAGDRVRTLPAPDREAVRRKRRAGYEGFEVSAIGRERGEILLDGDWLFMPTHEMEADAQAQDPAFNDESWHVIPVPSFWNFGLTWLYQEEQFLDLEGPSRTKGVADALFVAELDRLNAQTFDWQATRGAWYRHHIRLPDGLGGRRIALRFDAVAKIADVFVNGRAVGSHVGMFGGVCCDISTAVRPGSNVVAVRVIGGREQDERKSKEVVGVAITVEVTNEMVNSLPHGIYRADVAGVWQPVRLIVTDPVCVQDVFVRPALDRAEAEIEVLNSTPRTARVDLRWRIVARGDGSVLASGDGSDPLEIPAGETKTAMLATPKLAPRLWTPADPNLYDFEVTVSAGGKPIDRYCQAFGFRTFETSGSRLALNGKPLWLRGGNHFPHSLRPNDEALAETFCRQAREGNVMATRTVTGPMTSPWLDATDRHGILVSQEGTWPWLMLKLPPPDPALIDIWLDEFAALVKKGRNHPSLVIWTVANEMKFYDHNRRDPEMVKRKWEIVSRAIRLIRGLDPTRPVIADSNYIRRSFEDAYQSIVERHGFDDGDIDDAHRYWGWYRGSAFSPFDGSFGDFHTSGRPLISQETSTGYPSNDDHPTRSYLFAHHTPQAFVGDYAWEHQDPAIFTARQAMITKEIAEALRRTNRNEVAGIMHFAYLTWFTNVWDARTIRPKPAYHTLRQALQPVLVSVELFSRHAYAGDVLRRRVCLANDSADAAGIPAGRLVWEIRSACSVLASGSVPTPHLPYYSNHWMEVDFALPDPLPAPRVSAELAVRLEVDGAVVSSNSYDLLLAERAWTEVLLARPLQVFDPGGKADGTLEGLPATKVHVPSGLDPLIPLVIGDATAWMELPDPAGILRDFVGAGGRALILNGGAAAVGMLPGFLGHFRSVKGEIVTMNQPESAVFDGIEPLDTAWFSARSGKIPRACTGTFLFDRSGGSAAGLAYHCDIHTYLKKPEDVTVRKSGYPLIEVRIGTGRVFVSELLLSAHRQNPVAGRLRRNLIAALAEM